MRPNGYSRAQIGLHWGIAVLVIGQFVLHDPIVAAWEALAKGETPEFSFVVLSHVIGGSLVLLLSVWRLSLRVKRGAPALPENEHAALKALAYLTQWSLYALMFVMPITGLAAWFGGNETADLVHTTLKWPLLAFVLLHFAGALFQQFILKTNVLRMMINIEK